MAGLGYEGLRGWCRSMGKRDRRRQTQGTMPPVPATRVQASPRMVVAAEADGDGHVVLMPARRWNLLVLLASTLGVALGVVAIALNLISVSTQMARTRSPGSLPPSYLGGLASQGRVHYIGSLDAPVVVTEWSDFQCPACRVYALTRDPVLEQQYAGTGQVRFVYRNYPFLGFESVLAAQAAECAADQGKYWEYRSLLWQRQKGENQGAFSPDNLKSFAAELGLDQARFNACLDNGTHRSEVLAEQREAEASGINATPTIFVNDRKMQGVPTIDAMKAAIEEELAKKR